MMENSLNAIAPDVVDGRWKPRLGIVRIVLLGMAIALQSCEMPPLIRKVIRPPAGIIAEDLVAGNTNIFGDCVVQQPCYQSLTVTEPKEANWIREVDPIPPGLDISLQEQARPHPEAPLSSENQPTSQLVVEGTPTVAGTYQFEIRVACCRTMSGYMVDEWASFSMTIVPASEAAKDASLSNSTFE